MEGEERSKEKEGMEKEEEKEKGKGEVKEEETREGVTKVDIVLDCESKKSDAKDVCRQQKATNQNNNITSTTHYKIAPVLGQAQYFVYNALQGAGGVVSEAEKGEESKDDNCSCPEGFEFG